MKQKEILVFSIVVILAILLCLTTYMIVNSHEESLSTLRICNSCTIDAPVTNNTVESLGNGVSKFIFQDSNVNITHQKSENNTEIKKMNSDIVKNSEEVEDGIYYDDSTGTYSTFIENKDTGDAILITAKDINILKRIAKSAKFTKPVTPDTNATEEEDYSEVEYDYSYDDYSQDYEPTYPSDDSPSEPQETETQT